MQSSLPLVFYPSWYDTGNKVVTKWCLFNKTLFENIKHQSFLNNCKSVIIQRTLTKPNIFLNLVLEMEQELRNLYAKENIPSEKISFGFHWPPFISVAHLHMHGLAPTNQMNFLARWIFKPINYWFRTVLLIMKVLWRFSFIFPYWSYRHSMCSITSVRIQRWTQHPPQLNKEKITSLCDNFSNKNFC